MIVDLTNAFNLPGTATNIIYGNGDCDGNNIPAFSINPVTGIVDFTGATEDVALWYHVTYDLPGDNLSCSPNNCRSLSVTPTDPLNIQFDENTDAFVDGYYHICSYNNDFTMDDTFIITMVATFRNPEDTLDIPATFPGTFEMTYTEFGSATEYELCSDSFVQGASILQCNITDADILDMIDSTGGDTSTNSPTRVSGIELTVSITPTGSYTECSDTDTVRILIMPPLLSSDAVNINCASIPADFGTAFDFDWFEYFSEGGVNNGPVVNSNPAVYAGPYGESGEFYWIFGGVPPCIMSQLNFSEAALEQFDGDTFLVIGVPLSTSTLRHLDLTLCATDVSISFVPTFEFSTGYLCQQLHSISLTTTNCPADLVCYEVDISSTIVGLTVNYGLGNINLITTAPQFDCDGYGEQNEAGECLRAQLISDINEWFDINGFIGTATLVLGVMDSIILRIVDTNITFVSVTTEGGQVLQFTEGVEGCLVCEPGEEYFFDDITTTLLTETSTNIYTTLLLLVYPDAPNTGTFVIEDVGGSSLTCGQSGLADHTGSPSITNGGLNHGLLDLTGVLGTVVIGYEFEHPATGCDMCVSFVIEVIAA